MGTLPSKHSGIELRTSIIIIIIIIVCVCIYCFFHFLKREVMLFFFLKLVVNLISGIIHADKKKKWNCL